MRRRPSPEASRYLAGFLGAHHIPDGPSTKEASFSQTNRGARRRSLITELGDQSLESVNRVARPQPNAGPVVVSGFLEQSASSPAATVTSPPKSGDFVRAHLENIAASLELFAANDLLDSHERSKIGQAAALLRNTTETRGASPRSIQTQAQVGAKTELATNPGLERQINLIDSKLSQLLQAMQGQTQPNLPKHSTTEVITQYNLLAPTTSIATPATPNEVDKVAEAGAQPVAVSNVLWEPGDRVRIVKEGSQTGKTAVIEELNWANTGRVKVKMELEPFATKTYLPHEVEKLQLGRESIEKAGALVHGALIKWGLYRLTQGFARWRRLQVPPFELSAWRRMYAIIDADGNGHIDNDELHEMTCQFGMQTTGEMISSIMRRFDTNGDGVLDMNEFLDMMAMLYFSESSTAVETGAAEEEQWRRQYHMLDVEDKDAGSTKGLRLEKAIILFSSAGFDYSRKQVVQVYKHFNMPTDERLAFETFVKMIKLVRTDEALQRSVNAAKTTVYDRYLSGKFNIHPLQKNLFWWNLGTTFWVLYSAFLVPARLAFDSSPNWLTLSIDYLTECWFLLDVLICFHTSYYDKYTSELVENLSRVRWAYLKSWFVIDSLSSIPTTFIALVVDDAKQMSVLKVIRLLKIFRIVKLLKLKTIQELEESGIINPSIIRLAKIVFTTALCLHFIACLYWMMATRTCVLDSDVLSFSEDFCPDQWRLGLDTADDAPRTDLYEKYYPSFYWAIAIMLGNHLAPQTNEQYRYTAILLIIGIGLFSFILAGINSTMASLDHQEEAKSEQMNAINGYLEWREVDIEICRKIRAYYSYLWASGQSVQQKGLFEELPSRLALELQVDLKEELLLSVRLFEGLQPKTLLAIMRSLEAALIMPGSIVIKQGESGDNMYIVNKGRLAVFVNTQMEHTGVVQERQMAIVTQGACFGELALFGDNTRTATVRALVYSEIEILSFDAVGKLAAKFPDLMDKLKDCAKHSYAASYKNRKAEQFRTASFNSKITSAAHQIQVKVASSTQVVAVGLTKTQQTSRAKKNYDDQQIKLVNSLYMAANAEELGKSTDSIARAARARGQTGVSVSPLSPIRTVRSIKEDDKQTPNPDATSANPKVLSVKAKKVQKVVAEA